MLQPVTIPTELVCLPCSIWIYSQHTRTYTTNYIDTFVWWTALQKINKFRFQIHARKATHKPIETSTKCDRRSVGNYIQNRLVVSAMRRADMWTEDITFSKRIPFLEPVKSIYYLPANPSSCQWQRIGLRLGCHQILYMFVIQYKTLIY